MGTFPVKVKLQQTNERETKLVVSLITDILEIVWGIKKTENETIGFTKKTDILEIEWEMRNNKLEY